MRLSFSIKVSGYHFPSGLYPLRRFVTQGQYELRVDIEDWDGSKSFAKYHEFSISDSTQHFKLTVAGYEGTAGKIRIIIVGT